jgi:hypothetical protein
VTPRAVGWGVRAPLPPSVLRPTIAWKLKKSGTSHIPFSSVGASNTTSPYCPPSTSHIPFSSGRSDMFVAHHIHPIISSVGAALRRCDSRWGGCGSSHHLSQSHCRLCRSYGALIIVCWFSIDISPRWGCSIHSKRRLVQKDNGTAVTLRSMTPSRRFS